VVDSSEAFSSFLTSGLYRTRTEIADKNSTTDFSTGGNINYQTSNFKVGINAVNHQFSKALQKRDEPYNYFAFTGKNLWNASVDYSYTHKNFHFFGEMAFDKDLHKASVNGVMISVDPKIDLSFLCRSIQKEYQTIFGNAFTESTLPINERGTYAGIALRPAKGWTVNAYADFFSFPWLRYRVDAASSGREYLVQVDYQPNKQSEIYVLYRTKTKPLNESGNAMNYPMDRVRQNLRLHLVTQINPAFAMKARAEMVWYDRGVIEKEEGFLAFIEGTHKFKKLGSNVRLQYFETGGFDSRIYAYENDVLYSFSIPAFFDKGFRYYFNLNYDISKHFTCWLRWAQTIFKNKENIGSALDQINDNKRTEIKLQLLLGL
jgi:hypothetical protein